MKLTLLLAPLLTLAFVASLVAGDDKTTPQTPKPDKPTVKIEKSDEDWRKLLTDEEFRVARKAGTERPNNASYDKFNAEGEGTYYCVCCGTDLFESERKFDAGCGWPSFWLPLAADRVHQHRDLSHGMVRTEVTCACCDAHLGHVFDDGPEPSGLRYCINSASLGFRGSST